MSLTYCVNNDFWEFINTIIRILHKEQQLVLITLISEMLNSSEIHLTWNLLITLIIITQFVDKSTIKEILICSFIGIRRKDYEGKGIRRIKQLSVNSNRFTAIGTLNDKGMEKLLDLQSKSIIRIIEMSGGNPWSHL